MNDNTDEQILGVLKSLSPEAFASRVEEISYLKNKYPDFFPDSQVNSSATQNKYKAAEIRERNRKLMDDEAHKLGYKSWMAYSKACDEIEADCEARGVPFNFDMVLTYPPLHSGRGSAIFSMANDDLRGKDAFFGSLAVTLRKKYSLSSGSSSYNVDGKAWAFYDGVVNQSNIRFVVKFVSFNKYAYEFDLNGVKRSGEIKDLSEIRGILP